MEFITQDLELEYEGRDSKATLRWEFIIEMRSWGVKSICAIVPEQDLTFWVDLEDEEGNYLESKEITLSTKGAEVEGGDAIPCYPERIEVYKGKMTIFFPEAN